MRRIVLGSAVAGAVLLAFLLGALFAGGSDRDADPPCEEDETPTPEGDGCVLLTEACNVYGQVVDRQTLSCVARSEDGRGLLRPMLAGTGRVDVTVFDGAGSVVFTRASSLAEGSPADVPLQGKAGAWRLQVRFTDVRGDVRVVLWG